MWQSYFSTLTLLSINGNYGSVQNVIFLQQTKPNHKLFILAPAIKEGPGCYLINRTYPVFHVLNGTG